MGITTCLEELHQLATIDFPSCNQMVPTNFAWWRGGMLSKHIFQKGILPQRMIKNAARQGGCEKINGVQYVDGVEVPKRSRQFLWRAAVEMSKTASQLALQVRYLDLHVRWNELVRPEQPLQDGKGPETEASAFRNACIVDKKVLGNKISYGVVFENQKHLPSRVMKNILEVEKTGDGKEKYWFVEMRIPLYLIKEYEKEVAKVILTTADKHKKDNMGKCLCTLCQLDVPFRFAARCSACQGYCHAQCAVRANVQMGEHVEFIISCKRCYHEKVVTPQNEIVGDSPTSPLLLQAPESQHPATVIKGGKQNGYGRPLEYLNQSSEKNSTTSNRKTCRSGKQNGIRRQSESVDQSSKENGKKPPLESSEKITTNDSSVVKKNSKTHLSWGLIWKKKDPEDTGIDFRLKHLLLKGNPNGNLLAPVCHLCTKPYNCDLMYIQCTDCDRWYHADAVELKESKILELLGFKCCRCRRIRIPLCPYTDPEMRKKLEAKKKPQFKNKKQKKSKSDSKSETNDKQVKEREPDGDSVFDTEDAVNVQEDDSLYSFPKVEPVNDRNFEASGAGAGPGSVPKKLQVRRHIKSEKESDGCSTNFEPPRNHVENNPNPGAESASPIVEWDVSTNGFQDDMMFDYEDLNYEDMEFEPQTYFSFNELLASDNGDPPGDVPVNPSGEEYQMGITYDEQEPMFSVESGVDMVPCNVCSLTEPCPDLYCQTCGLWIHQHCSPWDDESCWEPEGVWKCGHCREWR